MSKEEDKGIQRWLSSGELLGVGQVSSLQSLNWKICANLITEVFVPIYASRDKLRQELDDLGMSHLFAKSLGKSEKCRHVCAFCHHFVLPCSGDNTDGGGDAVCKFTILFCRVMVIILMMVVMMFIFADLHLDDRDQRC